MLVLPAAVVGRMTGLEGSRIRAWQARCGVHLELRNSIEILERLLVVSGCVSNLASFQAFFLETVQCDWEYATGIDYALPGGLPVKRRRETYIDEQRRKPGGLPIIGGLKNPRTAVGAELANSPCAATLLPARRALGSELPPPAGLISSSSARRTGMRSRRLEARAAISTSPPPPILSLYGIEGLVAFYCGASGWGSPGAGGGGGWRCAGARVGGAGGMRIPRQVTS